MSKPVLRIGRTLIYPNGKCVELNWMQYLGFKLGIVKKVTR